MANESGGNGLALVRERVASLEARMTAIEEVTERTARNLDELTDLVRETHETAVRATQNLGFLVRVLAALTLPVLGYIGVAAFRVLVGHIGP